MTSQSNSRGVIGVITLLFTVLTALYLLIGGVWLLAVGGSAYYVITGIVLLGVAAALATDPRVHRMRDQAVADVHDGATIMFGGPLKTTN